MINKQFRMILYSQSLANLGDSLYIIAIVTLIYNATGSAVTAGFFPLLRVSSQGFSGIVAPFLLDRWSLTKLLWAFEIGQTCCYILLSILVFSSPSHFFISTILIIVFIISLMHGWAISVRNALIPYLVNSVKLVNANSILATSDQIVLMLGWTTGGILVVLFGTTKVLIGVSILFFISTILLFFINNNFSKGLSKKSNVKDSWESIKEGWSGLLTNPIVKTISIMEIITGLGGSIWAVSIILVFVKDILKKGENWWGYINAGSLAGTIIGGIIVYYFSKKIEKAIISSMIVSSVLVGLLFLFFAISTNPWYCLIIAIVIGLPLQLRTIVQKTVFQRNISIELLPKCFSALGTITYVTYGISVLLFGWLADQFGVQYVYYITSFLFIISSLLLIYNKTQVGIYLQQQEKPIVVKITD